MDNKQSEESLKNLYQTTSYSCLLTKQDDIRPVHGPKQLNRNMPTTSNYTVQRQRPIMKKGPSYLVHNTSTNTTHTQSLTILCSRGCTPSIHCLPWMHVSCPDTCWSQPASILVRSCRNQGPPFSRCFVRACQNQGPPFSRCCRSSTPSQLAILTVSFPAVTAAENSKKSILCCNKQDAI
jgi:hypothetical protein